MTDKEKLEKIRSEVIWYIHLRNEGIIIGSCGDFEKLLKFIDSMQEESTSVWHDVNTLPSEPNAVIVEHNEYSTSICRAEQISRVKGAKWAYVEDLLKL